MSISSKKSLMLLLTALLINSAAYSQKMVLTNSGDTSIVYTVEQSRFLLQQYFKAKEANELADLLEANLALQDSVVEQQRQIIAAKNKYISNLGEISDTKDLELSNLQTSLNKTERKLRNTKRSKWILVGLGILGGAFVNHLSWKYYQP